MIANIAFRLMLSFERDDIPLELGPSIMAAKVKTSSM